MRGKLKNQMTFPTKVYEKMNGYLGIVSEYKDDFYISSKSAVTNSQAKWLEELFKGTLTTEQQTQVKEFIKEHKVSLIFEVIKPIDDPHIIDYPQDKITLINIVYNTIEFKTMDWEAVEQFAKEFGFELPRLYQTLDSWEEFLEFYDKEMQENPFDFESEHIEGYVLKCSNNFMTKLKLPYYTFWKYIRGGVERELINRKKDIPSKLVEGTVEYDVIHHALDLIDNEGYNFVVTDFVKLKSVQDLVKDRKHNPKY